MNSRGALLVSLAREKQKSISLLENASEDFSERNEVEKSESFEHQMDKHLNEFSTEAATEKCGVTRAKSITATLLRKHLATITQLLQFSNNDMEQLSKFMGHTLRTHCNVYRMSDNIYQTAKVSKLLLLMMEGGAENFKGKQLDEIDINLTPMVDNQDVFEELIQDTPQSVEEVQESDVKSNSHPTEKEDKKVNDKKIIERQSWTVQQKRIISKHFAKNIKRKEPPKQLEVNKFVELYPELFGGRKWTSIKAVVYNIYTGKLKVK